MKAPSITTLKKYLTAILKIKAKYITPERLSKVLGLYPEVITETLSYFDPMINMDPEYDVLELVPAIKDYIAKEEEKKTPVIRTEFVTRKNLDEYESVGDFIYRKMSVGGLIDKNAVLTDKDLRMLKKLISEEQTRRKNKR